MTEPTTAPEVERAPDFLPLRLVDLLARPVRLMAHVGRWPRWWQAGLLLLILNGVATTWMTPIMVADMHESIASRTLPGGLDGGALLQELEETSEAVEGNKLGAVLGNGLQTWAMTIVLSLVLYFFARLAEGQGRIPQAMGIVHWAALIPYGLGTLIKLPLVMLTGEYARVTFSAAAFLPDHMVGGTLFTFLSFLTEVTHWWGLIVIIIGFEQVFGMRRKSAALSIILPWALATTAMAAFRALFGV